jgi:Asp-tRNA(Asn)/Glu-tRNA(Gln) amidotransferase B subunit
MKEHSYDFKALPVTPAQFAGLINMLEKMGFLIGQSMKLSKGKANPKRLQEIFKEKLI